MVLVFVVGFPRKPVGDPLLCQTQEAVIPSDAAIRSFTEATVDQSSPPYFPTSLQVRMIRTCILHPSYNRFTWIVSKFIDQNKVYSACLCVEQVPLPGIQQVSSWLPHVSRIVRHLNRPGRIPAESQPCSLTLHGPSSSSYGRKPILHLQNAQVDRPHDIPPNEIPSPFRLVPHTIRTPNVGIRAEEEEKKKGNRQEYMPDTVRVIFLILTKPQCIMSPHPVG